MNIEKYKCSIRCEDIPEVYQDIVNEIGIENFVSLSLLLGGTSSYIPTIKSIIIPCRNRLIIEKSRNTSYRELAREFRVSVNHIKEILKKNYN